MYGLLAHTGLLLKSGSSAPAAPSAGFLLHFDGTNGSTVFTDERGHPFSAGGNAQISTAQSVFGGAAGLFDGSGDYLVSPANTHYDPGTGDFTLEGFVRFISLPSGGAMTLVGNYYDSSNGWAWQFRNDGGGARVRFGWGDSTFVDFAWSPSTGTWYHLAVSRSGGTLRAFVNGAQIGSSATFTTDLVSGVAPMHIGALKYMGSFIQGFNGYFDDLRLTIGTALYTGAFTPPSSPLT